MTEPLASMRREIRSARRSMAADERERFDAAIATRLIDLIDSASPRRISSYLATDGEPDLTAVHGACALAGVDVVVPVMGADHTLEFRPLAGALTRNRSGILEPRATAAVPFRTIDLVLVPLVVFDDHCNRAGRGGGWYDGALAARGGDQLLVGVAYELQHRPVVPTHAADVALDAVATEQRVVLAP